MQFVLSLVIMIFDSIFPVASDTHNTTVNVVTAPLSSHSGTSFVLSDFFPLLLLSAFIFYALQWSRSWCQQQTNRGYPKSTSKLPPGSMGWPYIGETLKLYTENPNSFFSDRQKRYGDIFKTHILGCPCVMITSPEAAQVVLVNKAHLFKPTYPWSKMKMIGPQALFFHQGDYHFSIKKLIQSSLFVPSVLSASVPQIESIVLNFLPSWNHMPVINTLKEMKKYAFEVAMISAFGGGTKEVEMEEIKYLYHCLEKGYNSMPIKFPGTRFRKAMKARQQLNETMKKLIAKRRDNKELGGGLLGVLLKNSSSSTTEVVEESHNIIDNNNPINPNNNSKKNNHIIISDSQIADNIIGLVFAAHDTTASVLTWILKYLHDNQQQLQAVTIEQEAIRQTLITAGRGLTWEDTKNMPLTSRVIQETLRAASILSFTFREAVKDVEFHGYTVPKGWKVLPLFRSIHHSPNLFPQPDNFDPSRFEVSPKPNTYMPFGKGVHSCPGSELAKLEMLIFLHHLTTSLRWRVVGEGDGIQYSPFPVPKHGLPIKVHPKKELQP